MEKEGNKEEHKVGHKSAHKETHHAKKHKKSKFINFSYDKWTVIFGVLAIIIIGILVSYSLGGNVENTDDSVGGAADESKVAATVNDVPIMMSEVEQQYEMIPEYQRGAVTHETIIDYLVDQELLLQEAKSKGITVSDKNVSDAIAAIIAQSGQTEEQFKEQLEVMGVDMDYVRDIYGDALVIMKLLEQEAFKDVEVSEAESKAFYDQNKSLFMQQEQVEASHILVNTSEKAEEIIEQIKKGADFADLAKEYSIDYASGEKGGELGYFGRGQMVKPFEDAAFNLSVGEISEPVKTQFGYHIIKVTNKKDAKLASYEEVKDQIDSYLLTIKQAQVRRLYVDQLKQAANIKIFYSEGNETNSDESEDGASVTIG